MADNIQQYIGEICPKCGKSRLDHPEVYIFECPSCKFKYKCDPSERSPIKILHKSNFKPNRKKTPSRSPKKEMEEPHFIKVSDGICPFDYHKLVSYREYCKSQGILDPEFPIKDGMLYCRHCDMIFQKTRNEVKK